MDYYATIDTCIMQLFIVPTIFLLFTAVLLCREIYLLSRTFRRITEKGYEVQLLLKIVSVVGLFVLLMINCRILKQGIWLPFEDENQAVSKTGIVDHIKRDRLSSRFFPSFETDTPYSYGGTMVIDGESYYCLSTLGWKDGNLVSFSYLPKSKIILRCEMRSMDE